jgi:hypothetical protein
MSDSHHLTCSFCRRIRRLKSNLDFADADYSRAAESLRESIGVQTVRRQDAIKRVVNRLQKERIEAQRLYDEAKASFNADPYQCSFYKRPEVNEPDQPPSR